MTCSNRIYVYAPQAKTLLYRSSILLVNKYGIHKKRIDEKEEEEEKNSSCYIHLWLYLEKKVSIKSCSRQKNWIDFYWENFRVLFHFEIHIAIGLNYHHKYIYLIEYIYLVIDFSSKYLLKIFFYYYYPRGIYYIRCSRQNEYHHFHSLHIHTYDFLVSVFFLA